MIERWRVLVPPFAVAASILILLAAAQWIRKAAPPGAGWRAAPLEGDARLDGVALTQPVLMGLDQRLETGDAGRARLEADGLLVAVGPGSRLFLPAAAPGWPRLSLDIGAIEITVQSGARPLLAETPAAEVTCRGVCALQVEADSVTRVEAYSGPVTIVSEQGNLDLEEGTGCAVRVMQGPGTPYEVKRRLDALNAPPGWRPPGK